MFILFRSRKRPADTYRVDVIALSLELDNLSSLPLELQYIAHRRPKLLTRLKKTIAGPKAIGIRTVLVTPKHILKAVNEISVHSQHRMILTWLPRLLWSQEEPVITDNDRKLAQRDGIDLDTCVATILKERFAFKRLMLIDEMNEGISDEERKLVQELNEELYPLTIHYIVERIIADNAHERTAVAQAIIKALIIIGPVTHALETVARGIGKVFAASTDDVLAEAAELFALRGSGFTWWQLAKRSKVLVPVFIVATWGAFQVEGLIERGNLFVAGVVFGLSAVALSLTTAVQSIRLYHHSVEDLISDKKHTELSNVNRWKVAFIQDFTNPARLGLLIGAVASPIIAGSVFLFWPSLVHNGWILAMLGTTETLVAGLTVLVARRIEEWRLYWNMSIAIRAAKENKPWPIPSA